MIIQLGKVTTETKQLTPPPVADNPAAKGRIS